MTTKLAIIKFSETEFAFAVIERDQIHCHSSTHTFYPTLQSVLDDRNTASISFDDELDIPTYQGRPYTICMILNEIDD